LIAPVSTKQKESLLPNRFAQRSLYQIALQHAKITYKITITFSDQELTTEQVLQAANFVSETLSDMQLPHVMQCHKDRIRLAKIKK
jgi:hypothetical protein